MSLPSRNNILYDNYIVKNMQGDIIFYCSKRKADWYINKKLATFIDEKTIQLNFKTNGNGHLGDEYYIQDMDNKCVVCGVNDNLTRHHIVPVCFRKFFPDNIKNHSHHDILLLCISCHEEYEYRAYELKYDLEKEYNAPVSGEFDQEHINSLRKCRNYAKTLLKYGNKIPEDKKEYMISFIKFYLEIDDVDLTKIQNIDLSFYVRSQGEIIAEKLKNDVEKIQLFVQRWRQHFVDTMFPKYLPLYWNIEKRFRVE